MNFVVNAPPYIHRSGGIKVLYILNDLLNKAGHSSRVSIVGSSDWCAPDEIAVYPEIVSGNPLCALAVVRWCLNVPGFIGGETHYHPGELVLYFDEWIRCGAEAAAGKSLEGNRFNLNFVEPRLFFNDGKPKSGAVFFKRHGKHLVALPEKCAEITHEWPALREDLAALLRGVARFYSCYPYTALLAEAHLCGAECFVQGATKWERVTPNPSEIMQSGYNEKQIEKFLSIVSKGFRL